MPYIKREDRAEAAVAPFNSGELNYALTKLCLTYVEGEEARYALYNDVMGALEACKLEFYRRLIAEYEDGAIARNGDVYPCD